MPRPPLPIATRRIIIRRRRAHQLDLLAPITPLSPKPIPPPPATPLLVTGRTPKLLDPSPHDRTINIHDQIILLIRGGTNITIASESVGITRQTFKIWMDQGKSLVDDLSRFYSSYNENEILYHKFFLDVIKAKATWATIVNSELNKVAVHGIREEKTVWKEHIIEVKDDDGNVIDIKRKRYKESYTETVRHDGAMALKLLERGYGEDFAPPNTQLMLTGGDGGAVDVNFKVKLEDVALSKLDDDMQEKFLEAYDKLNSDMVEDERERVRRRNEKVVNGSVTKGD